MIVVVVYNITRRSKACIFILIWGVMRSVVEDFVLYIVETLPQRRVDDMYCLDVHETQPNLHLQISVLCSRDSLPQPLFSSFMRRSGCAMLPCECRRGLGVESIHDY